QLQLTPGISLGGIPPATEFAYILTTFLEKRGEAIRRCLKVHFPSASSSRSARKSHKHLDRTAGSEHSDNSSTHICCTRCQTKVLSFGDTPSYIQVGMFRSPQLQDPLNSIPLLLSCDDPVAGELLSLIGECCSAKEVVISVQEAVERLEVSLNADDDGFEEVEQEIPRQAASSPVVRLSILTGLYAASIPRLKLRKKTAPDTLRPLLTELETVNLMAGSTASTEEGRALISATASLVKRAAQWVKGIPDAKEEDALGCT
ncbi:uncharacterized protein LACBIDRAFT_336329, partial [Laccaria bicolor S238N-H82]